MALRARPLWAAEAVRRRDRGRPARPAKYREGLDGLPARIVGGWVDRKAFYIDRYARMVAVGMKNRWPRRCYIELFAGPGLSWDRGGRRFVAGSALMAMEQPFTDYLLVDIDPVAVGALRQRVEAKRAGRRVWVATADCNAAVDEIVRRIPPGAINLVFVDPTAAQVGFSTIERLAAVPRTDLLFTFHVGAIRRAARTPAAEIEAFFPPGADWRRAAALPAGQISSLLSLYLAGLEPYGYRQDGVRWVPMFNSRNALMYVLVLFTQHERGQDFWEKATAGELTGQTRLFPHL